MALKDVKKTTIIMKVGLFDWNVMPFGMKNAINILSRMTIEVFGDYIDKFLKMFVDDLNMYITTWEEHLEHLSFMLLKLREVNLKLNLDKCEFTKTCVGILGHIVNREGT
jgi:beta-glucosidase/6-phospho-beta-glucosidase/beta-galactosidase